MQTILVTTAFFGILLLLMAVRILFLKNGEFRGTCSTQKQGLKDMHEIECNICGRTVGAGECGKDDEKKQKELTKSVI